jgi:hypothetical protein
VISLKFLDGLWNKLESFNCHILCKGKFREIIEEDRIEDLDLLPINPAWATHEPGDGGLVKNEEFLNAMYNNWKQMADKYLKGYTGDKEKVKNGVDKAWMMFITVYRNDSAYFERLGGMISFLVYGEFCKKRKTCKITCPSKLSSCELTTPEDIGHVLDKLLKIKNIDQEHSVILEGLHRWWKANDKRLRSKLWIDTSFKIMIRKYKTDIFFRRTINMGLIFIANNADKWQDDDMFHPGNWFPKRRGKFCNAMFGWNF